MNVLGEQQSLQAKLTCRRHVVHLELRMLLRTSAEQAGVEQENHGWPFRER